MLIRKSEHKNFFIWKSTLKMSNLANNHNKVSSSHYAQSAGNEKEKFYLINLGNETLRHMSNTLCLDNPGTAGLCTQKLLFHGQTHFRTLRVESVYLWFKISLYSVHDLCTTSRKSWITFDRNKSYYYNYLFYVNKHDRNFFWPCYSKLDGACWDNLMPHQSVQNTSSVLWDADASCWEAWEGAATLLLLPIPASSPPTAPTSSEICRPLEENNLYVVSRCCTYL